MKKITLEYETKPTEEYEEIPDNVFEAPLELEKKDDNKPQLVIGILLVICMVFGIIAVFIPALVPLCFAPLVLLQYADIFSETIDRLHEKAERKLRERFLQK